MKADDLLCSRRKFFAQAGVGAAGLLGSGLLGSGLLGSGLLARDSFADELTRTPPQTEGPFYPNKLPLDTDNDLLIINDGLTSKVGEVTHLTGRVLGPSGAPLRNVVVEIWQCDANGVYLHTADRERGEGRYDKNFQGFGRFLTSSSGEYYFRTIKPVRYPGRTPHIHFKLRKNGQELLTTQCYVAGAPTNARDGVYGRLNKQEQKAVTVDFLPLKNSKIGELAAHWEIVLGVTPAE